MKLNSVVVFVEGGVVRSVVCLDPAAPKRCHAAPYCMVDYDALVGADESEIAETWEGFPEALKEYFAKFLPEEKQMYLDAAAHK